MKRVLTLVLCFALVFALIPVGPNYVASAAELDTITVNETWSGSWGADIYEKKIYLTPEETGYYDINVKDLKRTSELDFMIKDLDRDDREDYPWYETWTGFTVDSGERSKTNILLLKDHLYEITCSYGYYDDNYDFFNQPAECEITFTKTDYQPISLTLGTNTNLTVGDDSLDWIDFRTGSSGDYLITLSGIANVNCEIYEKESGKLVVDTYFDEYYKNRSYLEGNTDYIAKVYGYGNGAELARLKIVKAETDVKSVDIVEKSEILAENGYFGDEAFVDWYFIENGFDYKVTYSDDTYETASYYQLRYEGIEILDIIYKGKLYTYDDEKYFMHGEQPVLVYYMNSQKSLSNMYVTKYTQFVSDLKPQTDYDDMYIEYEDDSEYTYYWRIVPDESNMYELYSYDWDQISFHCTIYDENNNVVEYKSSGWNLYEGREYCLKITYTYNTGYYDDVVFSLEPNSEHIHDYHDVTVSLASMDRDGLVVTQCTECLNVVYKQEISRPKDVILSTTSYTFDGKAKKPTVTIYDAQGVQLANGIDFTVSYSNNINAGTAKANITFKGTYTGTISKTFTIGKQSSSKINVKLSTAEYTYDGKTKTPSVTAYNAQGKKLVSGTDYTVSYASGRKNIGKYKVAISFKGNYSGSKTLYFTIGPKNPKTVKTALYGYDDVKVSWSKVSGASGYVVYYKKASASSYTKLKTTTSTSYKKSGLSAGVKYDFKVVAYKTVSGNKCYNAGKTSSITTLKKVTGVKAAKSSSKVKVSWTNIGGETGYQISQSTSKSKTNVVATYKTTSGKSKTISATKGKTYYYKVRAYKVVDGKKIYAPWSSVVKYKR